MIVTPGIRPYGRCHALRLNANSSLGAYLRLLIVSCCVLYVARVCGTDGLVLPIYRL